VRRLARFVILRRRAVIVAAGIAVVVAGVVGGGVADRLSLGGFADPSAESTKAADILDEEFPSSTADLVLVVTAPDGAEVDDPAVAEAGLALTDELAQEEGIVGVTSHWALGLGELSPLRSQDGHQALVLASVEGDDDELIEISGELSEEYTGEYEGGLVVAVTGRGEVTRQVSDLAEKDLQKAEALSAPITFVALIVVFGSLVAALLPLGVGIVAVLGTFLVLTLITAVTDVSVFALNIATAMGLGLGIDYSLFVVSRYREELAAGRSMEMAISRTMQTAGRTVAFSAGTVAVSLSALLLFPIPYMQSFAFAGIAVVVLAAGTAIVVLPAVLAALGPRVEKGTLFRHRDSTGSGVWHRQAERVMRHPWPYVVVVVSFLLVLAIPFRELRTGTVDDRVLPESASSRAALDDVRSGFSSRESAALSVVVPGAAAELEALDEYAIALSAVSGVERVDALSGSYQAGEQLATAEQLPPELLSRFEAEGDDTWLSVVPGIEPIGAEGEQLVADVRAVTTPFEPTYVGGLSAELVDTKDAISARLPWAIGLIAVVTFILLFMMVGSLLVPLKALVLNVLSLTATFGAMVWIFQDGHLSGFFDITPTGFIDVTTPLVMFCIAFGLSMDYEVFLLSRIKEEYDLERDNEHAVAVGLEKTGRIVTAAALLLAIVFVGIALSAVSVVKLFGIGLALAVLVDAFLIRSTLVPAFMRLAGRANWWAPKPLRRFHLRFGIWENEPIAVLDRRDGLVDQPAEDSQAALSSEGD
jgi:putative drug exporter of the RND superfamily